MLDGSMKKNNYWFQNELNFFLIKAFCIPHSHIIELINSTSINSTTLNKEIQHVYNRIYGRTPYTGQTEKHKQMFNLILILFEIITKIISINRFIILNSDHDTYTYIHLKSHYQNTTVSTHLNALKTHTVPATHTWALSN